MQKNQNLTTRIMETVLNLTAARQENNLFIRERELVDRYPEPSVVGLPTSPERQLGIIQIRDMVGWRPFNEEVREFSQIGGSLPEYLKVSKHHTRSLKGMISFNGTLRLQPRICGRNLKSAHRRWMSVWLGTRPFQENSRSRTLVFDLRMQSSWGWK